LNKSILGWERILFGYHLESCTHGVLQSIVIAARVRIPFHDDNKNNLYFLVAQVEPTLLDLESCAHGALQSVTLGCDQFRIFTNGLTHIKNIFLKLKKKSFGKTSSRSLIVLEN